MSRPHATRMEGTGKASHGRIIAGLLIAAGILLFGLANTHLVYVAVESQPDCVPHVKRIGGPAESALYSAAKSAC